jgi:MYXO-CTERM domain-containing protein
LSIARPAAAFSFENPVSKGCHEMITADALRAIRREGRAPRLGYTRDEQAFADDLPFEVPEGLEDLAGVTLLVGVRQNDLKGRSPVGITQLSEVHGDPSAQDEHCLRTATQDGDRGTVDAIKACRTFIKNKLLAALDGLDARGVPDPSKRSRLPVTLAIRGAIEIDLPQFYVRMGEALHAVQDGFTHTYRTKDGQEITVVLNWIEHVQKEHDEARDGPAHLSALDECSDADEIRTNRRKWATSASIDVLRTALDPALDRAAKSAAFDRTLDQWFTHRAGCTAANRWCNAPEHALKDEGCGCSTPGRQTYGGYAIVLAALALFFRRARKLAPLALIFVPTTARADLPPPLGVHVSGAVAFDNPALAATVGPRYRVADNWILGLNAEWNPWAAVFGTFRTGAFNAYASGIKRWTIRSDTYALRSTLNLGTSTLLMDLYGAPRGSTGIFVGACIIGLEVRAAPGLTLIFNPMEFALPVPQLRGVFGYPQYRLTVGLQWGGTGF